MCGGAGAGTKSNRAAEYKTTTRAERASPWPSKKVRAKVRIRSQIETSAPERAEFSRAAGARVGARAYSAMRVRANWEGGHGCKK